MCGSGQKTINYILQMIHNPNCDPDRADSHYTFTKGVSRAMNQSINYSGGLQILTDAVSDWLSSFTCMLMVNSVGFLLKKTSSR